MNAVAESIALAGSARTIFGRWILRVSIRILGILILGNCMAPFIERSQNTRADLINFDNASVS